MAKGWSSSTRNEIYVMLGCLLSVLLGGEFNIYTRIVPSLLRSTEYWSTQVHATPVSYVKMGIYQICHTILAYKHNQSTGTCNMNGSVARLPIVYIVLLEYVPVLVGSTPVPEIQHVQYNCTVSSILQTTWIAPERRVPRWRTWYRVQLYLVLEL
jgi:hypothetical protein